MTPADAAADAAAAAASAAAAPQRCCFKAPSAPHKPARQLQAPQCSPAGSCTLLKTLIRHNLVFNLKLLRRLKYVLVITSC